MEFNIGQRGDVVLKEPTIGAWYCGFNYDAENDQYHSGSLGEYVGAGEFYDEDCQVDMRDFDCIVKQS